MSTNLDDKINKIWNQLYKAHQGNDDCSETPSDIEIPPALHKLMNENLQNKQEIENELKQLSMKWFWDGYYKGMEHTKQSELEQMKCDK